MKDCPGRSFVRAGDSDPDGGKANIAPNNSDPEGTSLDPVLAIVRCSTGNDGRRRHPDMRTTSESSFGERRTGAERRRLGKIDSSAVALMLDEMADGVLVVDGDG